MATGKSPVASGTEAKRVVEEKGWQSWGGSQPLVFNGLAVLSRSHFMVGGRIMSQRLTIADTGELEAFARLLEGPC